LICVATSGVGGQGNAVATESQIKYGGIGHSWMRILRDFSGATRLLPPYFI
jgi:hypothetical protein